MKIRTDFVSNSSSSSFILKDAGFFKHFQITVEDINNAIIDLFGGKKHYDELLKNAISYCDKNLVKADLELDKWAKKHYSERKANLLKNGLDLWCIYDMTDPKQRKACYKNWDAHFSYWIAPNEGDSEQWEMFNDMLTYKCDFNNIADIITSKKKKLELKLTIHGKKTQYKNFQGGAAFVRHVKKSLGVKTMKEVLHDKDTTLMIHFDDNEVYNLSGMGEHGKADENKYNTSQINDQCRKSKWDSESNSKDRFFEILIKYFVEKGKIDLSDKGLLEYWNIPEDHWWKRDPQHKNKKYFCESDDYVTWKEIVNDVIHENSIMHEG